MTTHQQEHTPYMLRWAFRLLSVEQITTEKEKLHVKVIHQAKQYQFLDVQIMTPVSG